MNIFSSQDSEAVDMVVRIKKSGNYFFSHNRFMEADRKYRKAMRYIDWFILQLSQLEFDDNADRNQVLNQFEKERLALMLNLSATTIKKGLYRESLSYCDEVSRIVMIIDKILI